MKKHLAIICGIFYPEPSATGQCAKRFAELLTNYYEIDIVCVSQDDSTAEEITKNGIRIHKLAGRRFSMEAKSQGQIKRIIHFLGYVQNKTQLLGNLSWFRTAAYKKLEEIDEDKPIDTVLSICSPFASHFAAMDFKKKHPNVRWCGYSVDPYSTQNRIRPIFFSYNMMIAMENKVLNKMDSVLVSEEVYINRHELYEGCKDCKPLPYMMPELNLKNTDRKFFDPKDINCVYAGSFYYDIRNPECMLKAFSCLNDYRIKLHLFSKGCEQIVNKYNSISSNIVVHEQVPVMEMAQIYRDADVLVNIGNATSEFLPSKIFEYISIGKPIVNFFYYYDEILAKYPLCFQFNNKFMKKDLNPLERFVLESKGRTVDRGEIAKLYHENTIENVLNVLFATLHTK